MVRPETEAYIQSALNFSREENPAMKEQRDFLKEGVITDALETLETFGVYGDEKTFVYSRNPHSSETTQIFKGRERATPEVEVVIGGNPHLLVLSEQLVAGREGLEAESIALHLLNPKDRTQVGRKAIIHVGVEKDYVTNFRGEKASIDDLRMMSSVLADMYTDLLSLNPIPGEVSLFQVELPDVGHVYDPLFDSFARSRSQE